MKLPLGTILAVALSFFSTPAEAANARSAKVIKHWTPEKMKRAIPRDLVIDSRGYSYLRKPDGSLEPYGHKIAAGRPSGGGGSDTTAPTISNMSPAEGAVVGASATFSATVTDAGGVRTVSFVIVYPSGQTQSFTPASDGNGNFTSTLNGFTDGAWGWYVVAKDNAKKGGNTATSATVNFTADTGAGEPPPEPEAGVVANAAWSGGAVQNAAGRIYFEMPADKRWRRSWNGYVCSGTVTTDAAGDRSIIITAAHCVYDDAYKAFARNVLFIPNQAETTGSATDLNCDNDPLGCWTPAFGVVDVDWTTRRFPNNIEWDYAYYVVDAAGAHAGTGTEDSLEIAAGSLPVDFSTPNDTPDGTYGTDDPAYTHALGYSYSDDPNFMFCAENMTVEGAVNWWLPSCGLSGGSSGGPWVQPMDSALGTGPIVSVNSWGYTDQPGMAGPQLHNSTAACLYYVAATSSLSIGDQGDGYAGVAATLDPLTCTTAP